ncbi:MAG: cytochrome c oxidase subunit 3 [Gammaproteobacteria bacterium]|nr:cytochrome c oxidase subunit 3 [Gammaproteobacteria bacterium]
MTETTAPGNESIFTATARDWSSDVTTFKGVPWGKAMMWIFLVSDTFIFTCFLVSYMTVRMTVTDPWPNPSEVFALAIPNELFGLQFFESSIPVPLLLIAIMTFVLISSSGTMAMAVNMGYQRNKKGVVLLMVATALLGMTFVGMQIFEWSKLIIDEEVAAWQNPMGAAQFGSFFFMVTGFHGLHVSAGVAYLLIVAWRVGRGHYDHTNFEIVEITGLYWHFVDLVWVFIFALFYLW